jgi:hypothetical protein
LAIGIWACEQSFAQAIAGNTAGLNSFFHSWFNSMIPLLANESVEKA